MDLWARQQLHPLSSPLALARPGSGVNRCQLLLRIPPVIVSTSVPSALTSPVPTLSKKPVTGLIDQRSISVPGAYPARLGKVSGAGVVKTISAGWIVTTTSGNRPEGSAAGVKSAGTSL